MIARLYILARLLTLGAAICILATVFLSFANVDVRMPRIIFWLLVGGVVAQLGLWVAFRLVRR